MKAHIHLAVTAIGLLSILRFILIAEGVLSKYFRPRVRNFPHSLTINFSNWKCY